MAEIRNVSGLTVDAINREVNNGARFVIFHYCFSIIFMTFKRGSDVYLIREGESTLDYSIGWSLITLFFGWWGIPWGPIFSIEALYKNIIGGEDVTREVLHSINMTST
jgi:hypothetical protein